MVEANSYELNVIRVWIIELLCLEIDRKVKPHKQSQFNIYTEIFDEI